MRQVYPILTWSEDKCKWESDRVASSSLWEAAEVLRLLEEILPHREFKIGQFSEKEFQYIRVMGI